LQYKIERNEVVKLIRVKKKEYYENIIDLNKESSINMWKILKEIIKGEPLDIKEIENVNFEILHNNKG